MVIQEALYREREQIMIVPESLSREREQIMIVPEIIIWYQKHSLVKENKL